MSVSSRGEDRDEKKAKRRLGLRRRWTASALGATLGISMDSDGTRRRRQCGGCPNMPRQGIMADTAERWWFGGVA